MIVIRHCRGFEELQACVDLQIEVWGYSDGDVIPRRAFLVAQKIGGQVIGAFEVQETGILEQGSGSAAEEIGEAGAMVGFALSLPGMKAGDPTSAAKPQSYLHSHMLAVREGYRNQSIGAKLKLAQRTEALSRGIDRIEWTFDPVEIKNAFLNIRKLGATVRRYEENFYGVSSSRLQGGLQTDRLVAEWMIGSDRVQDAIAGKPPNPGRPGEDFVTSIRVPAEIYAWKASDADRPRAVEVQAENRALFQEAFAQGLAVKAFEVNHRGDGIYYLG